MHHYITITFDVPDYPADAVTPTHRRMTEEEAIEDVRKRLEKQPYSWTLDGYHACECIICEPSHVS